MTTPARLFTLLSLLSLSGLHAEPQWIWASPKAKPQEKATFRHSFDLKLTPKSATLSLTCDNGATVFINGKKAAVNEDWQKPVLKADVLKLLTVGGSNVIEVQATNKGGSAGLIAKLELEKQQGGVEAIETGGQWQATQTGQEDWKPVAVLGAYGVGPWGKVFDSGSKVKADKKDGPVIAASDITVPKGFKVELLYSVPKEEQGSWVALTTDDKGRLIACDQYGSLYRMPVPAIGKTELLKPEKLKVDFGKAHGLLYAFGSLYVMVNENGKDNGLYRLSDTDKDDQYDKIEKLVTMPGGGEHGLHSMVVSPDGKRIYFNAGNHADLPLELSKSRPAKLWDEDHILPRMWDANGHARGKVAPGGFICSMTPDGKDVELFCYGFRNEFDIAFDLSGELFTYDADMEWDIGSPWYRPTRVNHCVSGADYGWRSGSGKWPQYYPDSLPTTLDIGPGSPTGVVSGKGAKFPAKYQRAVFIADWTYGTLWAVNLQPKGGSFLAEKEEFVFGKPLPLTDVIIHPQDGAMYFAIGGRRTQSGVYRVSYVGEESTAPVQALPLDEETRMRQTLEAMHEEGGDLQKILAAAWPYLSHSDRHVRYAARVAIEKLPKELWQEKALNETQPMAIIEGLIALARVNGTRPAEADPSVPKVKPAPGSSSDPIPDITPDKVELQQRMLETLSRLDGADLSLSQHLGALRALELILIRLGKPSPDVCAAIAERLETFFPSEDDSINNELSQLLIVLDSPKAPAKTLALVMSAKDDFQAVATDAVLSRNDGYANAARAAAGSRPNARQIQYMFSLRNAKAGWTPELRKTFFSWFPRARTWKGGNSFKGFIENIRKDSLATFVPESERAEMDTLSSRVEGADIPNYVAPKGPGRAWSVDEVVALTQGGLKGRDFKNGEAMYRSVMCATCHRFNGDGGSIGPDLTGSGNRYTMRDLMENIVDPSKVISDQYDSHEIVKKDGSTLLGRIVVEENGKVFVMANPFAPNDQVAINESEIARKEVRKVSMMPPGLINALNQDELLDLIAYLLSGGNDQDKVFK